MINYYSLAILIITLLVMTVLALYVLPKDWYEMNRKTPNRYLFALRVVMTSVTLSIILFSILPIAYQITRLDTNAMLTLQNASGLSGAFRTLAFGIGWIAIHVIADILILRDKEK